MDRGCSSKRLASSNKDAFLKIVSHIFMKRGFIAEEVAWGTPWIKVVAQNVQIRLDSGQTLKIAPHIL